MGRRAKIWLGEASSSWKDDYVIIFRGIIDDIDAKSGVVTLNVASPDSLQKNTTFLPAETELDGAISDVDTSATVLSTSDFLSPFTNVSGGIDESLKLYVRIDDEIMRYEATTATSFGSLSRGQLGTTAAAHADGAQAVSFYRLEGNAIDLALKFMLSGQTDPYLEDFSVSSFQVIAGVGTVANAIFLADFDVIRESNIRVGDYVTTTGATNAANNITDRIITDIVLSDVGYYIVVDGASLADEGTTSASISFESQYNTFGPGAGLGLRPEEVDIAEHIDVQQKYLSSAEYDFYIKEEIDDGKEFISEQIYNPVSAYSVPRKAQASVAYNIGPIPGQEIKTLDANNVTNASKLSIKRTTNKNFFNTIIYKFEEDALEDDRFTRGTVFIEGTSVTRIPIGNKALTIQSKGLREILSGVNTAQIASDRRLKRYKFGAESIRDLKTNFSTGFNVEIADKVIVNMDSLQVSDIKTGTRSGSSRICEVINKRLNIRTGEVSFDLLDTNFDETQRFALIAPSSKVKLGVSGTQFEIEPTFNTARFGSGEWQKWADFEGSEIIVRSEDFTTSGTALLKKVTSNVIEVETDLGFTPLAGYILEPSNYSDNTETVKLKYGSMSDADNDFADGKVSYKQG